MTLLRTGYTGSRNGMNRLQMMAAHWYVSYLVTTHDAEDVTIEAHHGDCTGGDAEYHVITTALGCRTVAHPPLVEARRAFCKADEIRPPKDYLARDWDIAYECRDLLAAPDTPEPVPHSGTWTTVGYALQLGRPVMVLLPDGRARYGTQFTPALLALAGGR